jgi:hypothetical protein
MIIDLALAVVLTPCLEGQQLRVPRECLERGQHVSYRHALTVAISARSVRPKTRRLPWRSAS